MVVFLVNGMMVADFKKGRMMDLNTDRLKILMKTSDSWPAHFSGIKFCINQIRFSGPVLMIYFFNTVVAECCD